MSKKFSQDNDSTHQNLWNNFFVGSNLEDEDENDEDYCLVEDKIENFSQYKNDILPYDFYIPKKELNDIIHDQNKDEFLENSLFSSNSRKRINKSLAEEPNESVKSSLEIKVRKRKVLRKKKSGSLTNSIKTEKKYFNNSNSESDNLNFSGVGRQIFANQQMNTSFTNSLNGTNANFNNNNFYRNLPNNNPSFYLNQANNFQISSNIHNLNSADVSNRLIYQLESSELIKLLLMQFDFFLQLSIQNLLLTNDPSVLYRCYSILYSFYTIKQRVANLPKLPEIGVNFNFCKIFNRNKQIKLRPQFSFFQAPILEIIPCLVQFYQKSFNNEDVYIILKEFFPFINPLFTPIKKQSYIGKVLGDKLREGIMNLKAYSDKNEAEGVLHTINSQQNEEIGEIGFSANVDSNQEASEVSNNISKLNPPPGQTIKKDTTDNIFLHKKRQKFDTIYDNLLMIGLTVHGKKNIELIQQLWVPSRSTQEIRHRFKNLTCKRAPENLIKNWKSLSETQLTKEEFAIFLKGIEWFGYKRKWNLISRYFLPERSAEYLESVFETLKSEGLMCWKCSSNVCHGNKCKFEAVHHPKIHNGKKKRIQQVSQRELSPMTKTLVDYSKHFKTNLINLPNEIRNFNSKTEFHTQEKSFEKLEIGDNFYTDKNKQEYGGIITRNFTAKGHAVNNINIIHNSGIKYNKRARLPAFDFHFKNSDDSAYEKIVID